MDSSDNQWPRATKERIVRQRSKRRVSLALLTLLLSTASPIILASDDAKSGDAVWTPTRVKRGRFQIDGDELTICWRPGRDKRPSKFTTDGDAELVLYRLRRVVKEKLPSGD